MKKYLDPILFEKWLRKSEQYAKVSKENQEIAKKFLIIAENDIQISKLLYENSHFAGAMYHLQQAFEKITKGYYIYTGRYTPEQVMGHRFILSSLKKEIVGEDLKNFSNYLFIFIIHFHFCLVVLLYILHFVFISIHIGLFCIFITLLNDVKFNY